MTQSPPQGKPASPRRALAGGVHAAIFLEFRLLARLAPFYIVGRRTVD
jgi:hypothetical protein